MKLTIEDIELLADALEALRNSNVGDDVPYLRQIDDLTEASWEVDRLDEESRDLRGERK